MWDLNSNQAIQIAQVIETCLLKRAVARGCDDSSIITIILYYRKNQFDYTKSYQLDLGIPETPSFNKSNTSFVSILIPTGLSQIVLSWVSTLCG